MKLKPTKKIYKLVKEELKKHWEGKIKLPPLKLAASYYFNHNLSYGPGFLGWISSVYANEEMYLRILNTLQSRIVKKNSIRP